MDRQDDGRPIRAENDQLVDLVYAPRLLGFGAVPAGLLAHAPRSTPFRWVQIETLSETTRQITYEDTGA